MARYLPTRNVDKLRVHGPARYLFVHLQSEQRAPLFFSVVIAVVCV